VAAHCCGLDASDREGYEWLPWYHHCCLVTANEQWNER